MADQPVDYSSGMSSFLTPELRQRLAAMFGAKDPTAGMQQYMSPMQDALKNLQASGAPETTAYPSPSELSRPMGAMSADASPAIAAAAAASPPPVPAGLPAGISGAKPAQPTPPKPAQPAQPTKPKP